MEGTRSNWAAFEHYAISSSAYTDQMIKGKYTAPVASLNNPEEEEKEDEDLEAGGNRKREEKGFLKGYNK